MDSKKNKIDDKEVSELVDYIDNFMSKSNAGHMNIIVNQKGDLIKETIYVDNTGGCVNSSCKIPNLFNGLDVEEEDSDDK